MKPYSPELGSTLTLSHNNDWLRKRQGLALPVLPPTTPEARTYFFKQMQIFTQIAAQSGQPRLNFELFAKAWNNTADGKTRFYITTEVLSAYSKAWEKASNTKASKELIRDQIATTARTQAVFAAPSLPLPPNLTGAAKSIQPSTGLVEIDPYSNNNSDIPSSLSVTLAASAPPLSQIDLQMPRSGQASRLAQTLILPNQPASSSTISDHQLVDQESEEFIANR